MVASTVFRGAETSRIAGISTAMLHKRVVAGDVVPLIVDGRLRLFTAQQVCALRLHHELILAGAHADFARAVLKYVQEVPDIDALVDSGRCYLAGAGTELLDGPKTREECREWLLEREESRNDPSNDEPIAIEIFVDIGHCWRSLRKVLSERCERLQSVSAAGQCA